MASQNEITGARLTSKPPNEVYRSNWDKIFGNDNHPITQDNNKEDEITQEDNDSPS